MTELNPYRCDCRNREEPNPPCGIHNPPEPVFYYTEEAA